MKFDEGFKRENILTLVDLVKTIESIENPQNLKIIREGACFYICLGESKKYFHFFKANSKNNESLPYTLTLDDLKSDEWNILKD